MYLSAEGEYAAGAQRDLHLLASAIYDLLQWAQRDPHFTIVSGPGSASHPGLSPDSFDDIVKYVKEGGKYVNMQLPRPDVTCSCSARCGCRSFLILGFGLGCRSVVNEPGTVGS